LDAALLLAEALRISRTALILAAPDPIPADAEESFFHSLDRRRSGECVAYILNRREFRGLDFYVTPEVLVPRPDTETLVEAALSRLDRDHPGPRGQSSLLLDLCTGSGAVAIALKHEAPGLAVYASDISESALRVARINALRLLPKATRPPAGVPVSGAGGIAFPPAASAPAASVQPEISAIGFFQSDLFENCPKTPEFPKKFDIITANPPYVPQAVLPTLAPEVQREPRLALDGGEEGLEIIRRILRDAPEYLNPGGSLLLEADPRQMDRITGLLASRGYTNIELYRDLGGSKRVIGGTPGRLPSTLPRGE
jgi:release factor glutamine methyltransferase